MTIANLWSIRVHAIYSFPTTAGTSCHMNGFKNMHFFSHSSGGQKPEVGLAESELRWQQERAGPEALGESVSWPAQLLGPPALAGSWPLPLPSKTGRAAPSLTLTLLPSSSPPNDSWAYIGPSCKIQNTLFKASWLVTLVPPVTFILPLPQNPT